MLQGETEGAADAELWPLSVPHGDGGAPRVPLVLRLPEAVAHGEAPLLAVPRLLELRETDAEPLALDAPLDESVIAGVREALTLREGEPDNDPLPVPERLRGGDAL